VRHERPLKFKDPGLRVLDLLSPIVIGCGARESAHWRRNWNGWDSEPGLCPSVGVQWASGWFGERRDYYSVTTVSIKNVAFMMMVGSSGKDCWGCLLAAREPEAGGDFVGASAKERRGGDVEMGIGWSSRVLGAI